MEHSIQEVSGGAYHQAVEIAGKIFTTLKKMSTFCPSYYFSLESFLTSLNYFLEPEASHVVYSNALRYFMTGKKRKLPLDFQRNPASLTFLRLVS